MARGKTYTGIVLEDETLKIANIQVSGNKITLLSLDKVRLVEELDKADSNIQEDEDIFGDIDDSLQDESIFGIEEEEEDAGQEEKDLDLADPVLDDIDDDLDLDFDDLDEGGDFDDVGVDMVDESETPASNELLFYNILNGIDSKRVNLGLSISAGNTIFQILKDVDFADTKQKDLQVIVDDRLESLHGVSKGEDYYSYAVRDDGALLLASIDDEAQLLKLINNAQNLYSGKVFIYEVLPDEAVLLGLLRANYELDDDGITGVIQLGETKSRVIFLKGNQLWIVSPIIQEGVQSQKFLSTIFSKILFQLDTGEVPNLDRLIICNNPLGDEAIEFFEDRFPDIDVSEFKFSEEVIDTQGVSASSVASFTTAIGTAWAASGVKKEDFPDISFLPRYVRERQKIFKLQWHGFVLLLLIFVSPTIFFNYFYRPNATEIQRLENEISSLESQIRSLEPVVQDYNRINSELEQIQSKLTLLNTLNEGTLRWSTNLDILNEGIEDVNNVWLTSLSTSDNLVNIDGLAVYRNRIPLVADIFEDATLLDVSSEQIRGQEVYSFRYTIREYVEDESIYSPKTTQGIEDLIGN